MRVGLRFGPSGGNLLAAALVPVRRLVRPFCSNKWVDADVNPEKNVMQMDQLCQIVGFLHLLNFKSTRKFTCLKL